jgi:hypothetical protein
MRRGGVDVPFGQHFDRAIVEVANQWGPAI